MKLVFSLWLAELAIFAIAANMIFSCSSHAPIRSAPHKNEAPTQKYNYPNVLDTMPQIAYSAMDELEEMVAADVERDAARFAGK